MANLEQLHAPQPPATESRLPRVVVLATGGTIAGQTVAGETVCEYVSGTLDGAALLASVPEIRKYARVETEQVAGIGSEDMTDAVWLRLAAAANRALNDPGVAGAVVLHGTDTMEETAYFLNLVAQSAKPVVLTGAMRPANAMSADGPMNILNAIRLAASPEAAGRGVLVTMHDSIQAARDVTKTDSLSLDAFKSPETGPLGRMLDGIPLFHRQPTRLHTGASEFRVNDLVELPRVVIVYGHAGQGREMVDAAVAAGARGIVHAGVGMGNVHKAARPALVEAAAGGVAVVCSSRVGRGVVPAGERLRRDGLIAAGDLNPQKARVLLQLALTRTSDAAQIQQAFDRY